jgi:hypothetical protein
MRQVRNQFEANNEHSVLSQKIELFTIQMISFTCQMPWKNDDPDIWSIVPSVQAIDIYYV